MHARILGCLALLALTGCHRAQHAAPPPSAPPNVLLITIDTLRADRLGRGFTPTLDRLAAGGLTFTQARTSVPLTLPAHATILSGLLPPRHAVRENGTARFAGHPTVATSLKGRGYTAAAAVGAFVLARQFGLDAGFDAYDDDVARTPGRSTTLEAERSAGAVTSAAVEALRQAASAGAPVGSRGGEPGRPFFLWAHYYDPHAPYDPPAEYRARTGGDAYNGEIAYVDAEVRRLVFEELGLGRARRDTLVVVAGDHGESLGEHGENTHGMSLYDAALRVPLIFTVVRAAATAGGPGAAGGATEGTASLAGPAGLAGRRDDPVSLADVAPTILAAVGVQPPAGLDGVNLLKGPVPDREIYAESQYPRIAGWSPLTALVAGRWKVIAGARARLFDMAEDPAENRDAAGSRPALAAAMQARLAALSTSKPAAQAVLSSEARERLRSLGYVAASPSPPAPGAPDPEDRLAEWNAFEAVCADIATPARRQAIGRLRQLVARNPDAQAFRTTLARALSEDGRHREALSSYREAAARWPGDPVLLHDLAVAARDAGDAGEALRAEQAALVIAPDAPEALNGLGMLQAAAGRFAEAAVAFERALKAQDDPSYASNLGNVRRAMGDMAGARRAYERALAIDASWPDAANGLGVLLVQDGKPLEAVNWIEKALVRAPDFVEAQLNLGIACQEGGRPDCARRSYRNVLRAGEGHEAEKAAARQLLGSLRD